MGNKYLCLFLFLAYFYHRQAAGQEVPSFKDISNEAGINNAGSNMGVAFGDFDNDGDDDVYISRTNRDANLLYENLGNNHFVEVAEIAGVNYGGATVSSIWGDINNDGYLDLYLGNVNERDMLYKNNGDGTFSNISSLAGIYNKHHPRSVCMADVNKDGFLDIYLANINDQNVLYLNQGNSTFIDNTMASGATDTQLAMGAVFFDYDNDGDPDLYLTHDGKQANILYQNDGAGHFTNVSRQANADYEGFGMGVDFGDFNNDGFLDLYITNLFENVLLKNNGDGTFSNHSTEAGIEDRGMGWGTAWLDFDNDGWQDIYLANDSYFSPFNNVLYKNSGYGSFSAVSSESEVKSNYAGYGTACSDINGDGLVDLFVANLGRDDGNQLFLNQNAENNWFKISLEGSVSNRSAIGARVEIRYGTNLQIDEVAAGTGFASQNSHTLHFGLGKATEVDEITIRWPNGLVEVHKNLPGNLRYKAVENNGISRHSLITAIENDNPENGLGLNHYPNPFSEKVSFAYHLRKNEQVTAVIKDTYGNIRVNLHRGVQTAGQYTLEWSGDGENGKRLAAGIYFFEISAGNYSEVRRIVYR